MKQTHFSDLSKILSFFSGILTAVSFYTENLSVLVFFSLIPLFYSLSFGFEIKKIYLFLFTYYTFSLLWLYNSILKITDNFVTSLVLFFILIGAVSTILSTIIVFPFCIFRFVKCSDIINLFLFPFIYIFGEWLQGNIIPITFPWIRLGNIASGMTLFIQSAAVFGTLFISLLIIYINLFLMLILKNIKNKNIYIYSLILSIILISDIAYGLQRIKNSEVISSEMTTTIVQGNYPRNLKFITPADDMLKKYLTLLSLSPLENTDLIIFPETSIHSSTLRKTENIKLMSAICRKYNSLMIFGTQYKQNDKRYNACMTIDGNGNITPVYFKRKLVPVGEYNPLSILTGENYNDDFSAGKESMNIYNTKLCVGCVICFESSYPEISSEAVRNGAEVIVVLSNDSWLGREIPLYQHHTHSIMRAIENNRYVLTSTNTGISSVINNYGEIKTKSKNNTEDLLYGEFHKINEKTPYTKYGDVIILPSCFIILFYCLKFLFSGIYDKICKSA